MSWARYDDEFALNRKVGKLIGQGKDGIAAIGLHLLANTYARYNGTAGVIEEHVPNVLCGGTSGKRLARLLADAGMFDPREEGGWTIHDYAEFHDPNDPEPDRSAADRKKELSEKRAEAGRLGGLAKAKQRSSNATDLLEANDLAKGVANDLATPLAKGKQRTSPVPVPLSVTTDTCQSSSSHRDDDDDASVDKYRAVVDRLAATRTSKAAPKSPGAYRRKVITNLEAEEGDKIRDLMQRYPDAPYDAIANAIEGDTHSLVYFAPKEQA